MTTNRRFTMALQALTDVQTDTPATPSALTPAAPALSDVLAKIGSIPAEALFLGVTSDDLPVLLNLYDPHPGPMLIAGDAGSGKTAFLQTIAHSLAQTYRSDDVQFGVITNYPDEWQGLEGLAHRAGVFAVGHKSATEFIHSLADWAHTNKNTHQCMLLLVDDLELVASLDPQAVQDFRWLLLRGPARRVWPIVTLNAPRYGQVISWLQNFRMRVFGHIAGGRVAEALGGDKASPLDHYQRSTPHSGSVDQRSSPVDSPGAFRELEPGLQFSMREREHWLRFWLPSC